MKTEDAEQLASRLLSGAIEDVMADVVTISGERVVSDSELFGPEAGGSASTDTGAELVQRRLDIVEMVVNGATIRQCADEFDIDYKTARTDYFAGLRLVNARTADDVAAMRDEITLRQKKIIMAHLPLAVAGDVKSAGVVARCDEMLAGLWGVRSIRLEQERRDTHLDEATRAYVNAIVDRTAEAAS